MRVIFPWLLMPLVFLTAKADEGASGSKVTLSPELPVAAPRNLPWVGLRVGKLDEVMRAHIPGVPRGVGFLVESVAPNGPAKSAGLLRFDVIWKFEDQLLINEAQFATLLKLRKAGDTVRVSVVRSGKGVEMDLTLGKTPTGPLVDGLSAVDLPLIPSGVQGMPHVRVIPRDRVAELTKSDGSRAKLFYRDHEAFVTIIGSNQESIYDGPVRKDGNFAVPDEWVCSVGAMLRSLYKAKNPDWMPRRPRPRVVQPSNMDQR